MTVLVLLLLLQDEKVTAGSDERPVLRMTLSGGADFRFAYRDETLEDARAALNGLPEPGGGDTLMLGRASLRFDIAVDERFSAVIEIESRSFDGGTDLPWGTNPESSAALLEQAYLDITEVFTPKLHARLGLQDLTYKLRPHDEPFFIEANEAESFYSGASTFVRTTADRDVLGPAGMTIRYDIADFVSVEFAWATLTERGRAVDDESLAMLYIDGILSERLSFFLLAALVSGAGRESRVWTVGLGVDYYPLKSRLIELYAEAYFQFGDLASGVDKRAWAVHLGSRVSSPPWWAEASFAFRSGDEDPADGDDEGFQSYENVNRFLVLEDAAFGLDIDTNVQSFRLGGGVSTTLGKPFEARVDLGLFRLDEDLRSAGGSLLTDEEDLGAELDVTLRWFWSGALGLTLRAGFLFGADAIDDLTDESNAFLLSAGADLRF